MHCVKLQVSAATHKADKYFLASEFQLSLSFTNVFLAHCVRQTGNLCGSIHLLLSARHLCTSISARLCLAGELGDCDPLEHTPELVSEFRFFPKQSETMETDILSRWLELR